MKNLFLLFFSLSFAAGCLSLKPGAAKAGKKLFETFYVGEEGTQYFIKPLQFDGTDEKSTLLPDFSFRQNQKTASGVTVNFTILSPDIKQICDSLVFSDNDVDFTVYENKVLFKEKTKDGFSTRFSGKGKLSDLKKLIQSSDWQVKFYAENQTDIFIANKKTKKKIQALNDNVFVLFR